MCPNSLSCGAREVYVPLDESWVELEGQEVVNTDVCVYYVFLSGNNYERDVVVEIVTGEDVDIQTFNVSYQGYFEGVQY